MVEEQSGLQTVASFSRTRVVCVGMGAIGAALASECLSRNDFSLVAIVDPARAREKIGPLAVKAEVSDLAAVDADVAFLATGSSVVDNSETLEFLIRSGMNVVSSCEELAFPWLSAPAAANHIDQLASSNDIRVLGCGVNPGFIMDALPVLLSKATFDTRRIAVTREVNLRRRRSQLTTKLGVGLELDDWRGQVQQHGFGHRGLPESAYLCALGAGWGVQDFDFTREPLVENGLVTGLRETVNLSGRGERQVFLELVFEQDGQDRDMIEIDASPPIRVVLEGGLHGDQSTIARMLECARVITAMSPGLRLPIEVPAWQSPIRTEDVLSWISAS